MPDIRTGAILPSELPRQGVRFHRSFHQWPVPGDIALRLRIQPVNFCPVLFVGDLAVMGGTASNQAEHAGRDNENRSHAESSFAEPRLAIRQLQRVFLRETGLTRPDMS